MARRVSESCLDASFCHHLRSSPLATASEGMTINVGMVLTVAIAFIIERRSRVCCQVLDGAAQRADQKAIPHKVAGNDRMQQLRTGERDWRCTCRVSLQLSLLGIACWFSCQLPKPLIQARIYPSKRSLPLYRYSDRASLY